MNFPSIRTALIAAVIVALAAFVLLRIGDATAQSGCIQPIPDSGTITGTWNADCLSENTPTEPANAPSGIRYARFYTFTVSEDADITIDLNSATDTYMFLMAGTGTNGAVLHENDDIVRGSNANSRISESLSAGDYTIEATTYELENAGDFTITVSGLPDVSTPTATPTIDAGDTPTVTPTPTAPATPTPAPTTVPTDVLNRLAALETLVATQQGLISTLGSKITTLDSRVAALEADVPSPTPPPTKTPTATPTTISTPTPTATPVTAATPEPTTPTLTPEAAAHAALSQLLPWYDDPPYPGAVIPIVEVWLRDPEFGRDLAQSPWITDGIDVLENDAVYGLGLLYDRDPALARRLLAYASEEPVQSRNTMFLGGLYAMLLDHRDKFEMLIAQSWFTDGIDAGERAFITTLSNTTGIDALYGNLLASPPAARSKTISLPLAGEVTLWAFHNASPPDEDLLGMMERGVRGAEGFMGAPFPLTDLIVLSLNVDDYDIGYGAVNFVNSLTLLWGTEQTIEETIVYHEIAHFYLTAEFGPLWLYEGGANFIAEYLAAGGGEVALEDHAPEYCRRHGVDNIHSLGDPNHPDPVADVTCAYLIGQYFLTHLYYIMGEAAFSSAMRELYERYLDYRWYPTDEEVYRIFLKHTPPDREAAFLDVYRRLHGGPFIDGS